MDALEDLDDPSQPIIYLPPRDDVDGEERDSERNSDFQHSLAARDIPEGYSLRMNAYKQAWSKCLERVQCIVRKLHTPVVTSVVSYIHEAYDDSRTVPGLPYPELPVIGVSIPDGGSILDDILEELEGVTQAVGSSQASERGKSKQRMDHDHDAGHRNQSHPQTFIVHLSSMDCPNLVSTMKAIVSGFVDTQSDEAVDDEDGLQPQGLKRKPTASLASYDINMLQAWYISLQEQFGVEALLLIVMHDFEQFDAAVLQDVFEICSPCVPALPLVFLLGLSAPSVLTYIRGAFPRSTLALLRIQTATAPSGPDVLEDVLARTFFDANFEPDVMIGPATVDCIVETGTRHTSSIDTLITILQLAHMKHFEEPLTVFVHDAHLGTSSLQEACAKLKLPTSFTFLDSLLNRLWTDVADQPTLDSIQLNDELPTVESLLDAVNVARKQTQKQVQKMRVGFQTLYLIRKFMQAQGYKTSTGGPEETMLELMTRVVRGRLTKDVKYLGLVVKKLSAVQLRLLLQGLHHFFQSLTAHSLRREEENARVRIIAALAQLPDDDVEDGTPDPITSQTAASIGEWLVDYIELRLVRLDQGLLWDIWNTGITPFPSELINPAPRLSVINALLHPFEVLAAQQDFFNGPVGAVEDGDLPVANERQYAIWELPDTSILFRRYMDSGRMINVYDWYESFAVALESQKYHLRKRDKDQREAESSQKRKGKGKQKAVEVDEDTDEDDDQAEKWLMEMQARFIRALHELDFMGFIKHTGRKADHVIKTIYDIPD